MKEQNSSTTTEELRSEAEPESSERSPGTVRGLSIRTLSLCLVAFTIVISVLIGIGIVHVMNEFHELTDRTKALIFSLQEAEALLSGSNYLTDQVRLYAVTRDPEYADAYFREVHETQRRDRALEALTGYLKGTDDDALRISEEAMHLSNELMELEIHAMKLAAVSADEDPAVLAPEVRDYMLTPTELDSTPDEQAAAAIELVYSEQYREMKRQIEGKMADVTESVIQICENEQQQSEADMQSALARQTIYTVLVVILVILSYIMIAILILRPIRIYIDCIEHNNFLKITGAYEFKYLAVTYNNVYEMTREQQNLLRQKAERDALTGLFNRQAFEQMKAKLHNSRGKLAFLLLDVDVFKSINDTYGHDTGDEALIKVAELLEENFRTSDYIFRIGGDEFAVIMEKMTPDKREIIRRKIEAINEILQHPQTPGFPKYSLSVGVDFSEKGFSDALFHQTDQALYHTKENGRCGVSFFDELEEG